MTTTITIGLWVIPAGISILTLLIVMSLPSVRKDKGQIGSGVYTLIVLLMWLVLTLIMWLAFAPWLFG